MRSFGSREFGLALVAGTVLLVACSPTPATAVDRQPTQPIAPLRLAPLPRETGFFIPTETKTPSPSPTATETRVTLTPTETLPPIATPTPTSESASDNGRRILLSQANTGETVQIDGAPVKDLAKFPWPFATSGDAILATVGDPTTEAVALSADCVYQVLRDNGKLGTERTVPGFWKPKEKLQQLKAKVLRAKTALSPVPLVNLISIKYGDKEYDCKEVAAIDRLKGYFQNLTDWDNLPGNVARLAGQIFRDMISGFKGTPAPTPN